MLAPRDNHLDRAWSVVFQLLHGRLTLREIFPAAEPPDDTEIYAERDTYALAGTSGYAAEHAEIFDPIERSYRLMLEISALISLHVGAYG